MLQWKRLAAVTLAVLIAMPCMPLKETVPGIVETITAEAEEDTTSGTCGENLTWVLDDEGMLTISGTGEMANTDHLKRAPWDPNKESIKKVIIEDGVTSIGDYAFSDCSAMTSVTIPDGVTSIGRDAFSTCSSLSSVTIPNSVTSFGNYAFSGCTSLTSVTIPDNVTSISNNIFSGCTSLTSLTIPDCVTSIGDSAFYGCDSLTTITIPESVTSIGGNAFIHTPWLKAKQTEDPLVVINHILIDGKTIKDDCIIPDSVTSIGKTAFSGNSYLTSVTIPESVTSIDKMAFYSCSALNSITILNPECEIFDSDSTFCHTFANCPFTGTIHGYPDSTAEAYAKKYDRTFVSLDPEPKYDDIFDLTLSPAGSMAYELDAPIAKLTASVPDIVSTVYTSGQLLLLIIGKTEGYTEVTVTLENGASYLVRTTVTTGSTTPAETTTESTTSTSTSTTTETTTTETTTTETTTTETTTLQNLTYTKENGTVTITGYQKDQIEFVIPEMIDGLPVTAIGDNAFQGSLMMTSLWLPDSIERIGQRAFEDCRLAEIRFPEKLEGIGYNAFAGTAWLRAQQQSDPLVCAGGILIDGTTARGAVKIPEDVREINDFAFFGCAGITSVDIPESVQKIGYAAFYQCPLLKGVTIRYPDCFIDNNHFTFSNSDEYGEDGNCLFTGTICGPANSTAEAYARKYGRSYAPLSQSGTLSLGDLNSDLTVNASDAAMLLVAAAKIGAGDSSVLTPELLKIADLNKDGNCNASDAALILTYAAAAGAGFTGTAEEYLRTILPDVYAWFDSQKPLF